MSDLQYRRELAESGMINATEACAILGCKLTRVYELRQAGLIPWAEIGGRIVFPRKGLIDYVTERIHLPEQGARKSRSRAA